MVAHLSVRSRCQWYRYVHAASLTPLRSQHQDQQWAVSRCAIDNHGRSKIFYFGTEPILPPDDTEAVTRLLLFMFVDLEGIVNSKFSHPRKRRKDMVLSFRLVFYSFLAKAAQLHCPGKPSLLKRVPSTPAADRTSARSASGVT
jgi:hypothetical protein